jgi:hypothetical protein
MSNTIPLQQMGISLQSLHLQMDNYNNQIATYRNGHGPRPGLPRQVIARLPQRLRPANEDEFVSEAYDFLRMNFDDAPRVAEQDREGRDEQKKDSGCCPLCVVM